jgi:drug/metabolite transporter (DMT)-like permease
MHGRGLLITLGCLVGTGLLLAMSTIMSKLASGYGLTPFAYLAWSLLCSGLALFAIAAGRGIPAPFNARTLEFWGYSAIFSMAIPFMLTFYAVAHVGVSFVALALCFPPFFTYIGALLFGIERFSGLRAGGVALALTGAILVALAKFSMPGVDTVWIMATLAAPVLLASGNVYRALRWPPGLRPEALAPGMLAGAGLVLLPLAMLPGFSLAVPLRLDSLLFLLLQIGNFTLQYTLFFILQHRGGPVMLSLIGAVAAVFGVPFGIVVMGEAVPPGLWLSGLLVAVGVGLTSWGGLRQARMAAQRG